jgi:hypothetical protein
VSLDRLVECDLLERGPGVCIRGYQSVSIGVDKHAHRKCSRAQHDLRGRFVLAVEDMECTMPRGGTHPRQCHMQLWSLLMKFFDQLRNIGANRARIYVIIMRQILNWHSSKEITKPAQLIFVNRNRVE